MNASKDISQLIANANEDDLRYIVSGWANKHSDFRDYVRNILCPPIEDVDFGLKLSQAVNRETKEFFSHHDVREATDWRNVYNDLIEPWSENADSLSSEKLYDLCDVIVKEVGMQVRDEDFYGDDWYGDDFSGYIQDIMDVLGNLAGLLLIREDVSHEILDSLKKLIKAAKKKDIIDSYIGSPYDFILELISLRQKADEVICGIYDALIDENLGDEAGAWVCRKIDFIRSMGLADEARKYMEEEIKYPEVCLKYYNELIDDGNWQDAIILLDRAQAIKDNGSYFYSPRTPNWLELKQQLLVEHGTLEERIDNLKRLFHNSHNDKKKYYRQLKELVDADKWNEFYYNLLSNVTGYNVIDEIAPFLIEEGELDWLFRLVSESTAKTPTDYRTPLKYAEALCRTHFEKMQTILIRTVRAYAADRFPPKKKVNSSKYPYFRADLESLSELGYSKTQKEIVEFLLQEYRFRPSLTKELKSIKLVTDNG
ncbi:hypothetical protein [uncultured Duncaniella sp.]|uniref:hypothetical protein n=1 Tax=uncultured Duncaniella sp. TaxID=2768039 RepID=UPI0025A9C665|nr:hypothetical protein [uncultured Duncaniella sp.]